MKVVFLDIDGVLNGYNWCNSLIGNICTKIKPLRALYHKWDLFGVRTLKVLKLKYLLYKTGARVVLSSSWRFMWETNDTNPRILSLKNKFKFFNIEVIGITPKSSTGHRGNEIKKWFSCNNYKVDNFIILDDEISDLSQFEKNVIKTSSNKMIEKYVPKTTGLKWKHVRKGIKMLNKKNM